MWKKPQGDSRVFGRSSRQDRVAVTEMRKAARGAEVTRSVTVTRTVGFEMPVTPLRGNVDIGSRYMSQKFNSRVWAGIYMWALPG